MQEKPNFSLTRRQFLRLSAGMAGSVALVACAAPGVAPAGGGGAAPAAETIVIEFLGDPGNPDNYPDEQAKFREENPGLDWKQVQQQEGVQLLTLIAAGTPPDAARVESNLYRTFVKDKVLVDITDLIEADSLLSKPDYWLQPQETDRCAVDGRWYGIGSCWVAPHMYFNAEVFEAAGIEPPSNDPEQAWEWDKFVEVAKQMTTDVNGKHPGEDGFDPENVDVWGVNWPTWWIPLHAAIQSNEGTWINSEGKLALDSPEATQALQRIADLRFVHQVMPQAAQMEGLGMSDVQLLETKKVAMHVDGSWALSWLYKIEGKLGTAVLPKMKRPATDLQAHIVTIVNGAKHTEEAWQLVRFLSSPWYQQRYCEQGLWLPSQTALTTPEAVAEWCTEPVHPAGYVDIVTKYVPKYGHFLTMPTGYIKAQDTIVNPALTAIFNGEQTAEEAMKVIPDANKVMEEEAARGG
ncbi:MAG: extracellular solute-binding protein [Caldilinea sp. CFX5]|nr:extracellular solute-binding protein [Caldilinea sp. CFX5]